MTLLTSGFLVLALALAGPFLLLKLWQRLMLSRAKHRSLSGHAKWSRRMARLVPYFDYSDDQFFISDGTSPAVGLTRRHAFTQLTKDLERRAPVSCEFTNTLTPAISDLQFTANYQVPFPYRRRVQQTIPAQNVVEESAGVMVKDLDGNWSYDLSGSYGVNVFGYDFYKKCLAEAEGTVANLGPVLGPYHPLIGENIRTIREVAGLDEVSFHMSGTEAVMQAVRLARYHTGRARLVRFCGAYHGWWDGVQPGVGNQRKSNDVFTLSDMSEKTLKVLRHRDDVACVLINPLQAMNPNRDPSGDGYLFGSTRTSDYDKAAYSAWLRSLREVCTERKIVLIFDEVFTGFRLAFGGAQEFFGVQADMVTYGKTLGGGLPVGVVCGREDLMKRYREDQPANISFARGTFNSHPTVVAAMNSFLKKVQTPECRAIYEHSEAVWDERVQRLNAVLQANKLPLQVANMSSILTVLYTEPARYNWLLQFYLRKHGLHLSWVGTGRLIMSLNYSDEDFAEVIDRFVAAGQEMAAGAWWQTPENLSNENISRMVLKDMLRARLPFVNKDRNGHNRGAYDNPLSEIEEV